MTLTHVAQAADGDGSITVTPDFSIAGEAGTWSVTYTTGASGLPTGGSIRIEMPTGWSDARFSEPQFTKPEAPHYTTIRSSSRSAKLYHHVENYLPLEKKRHWFRRVIYIGVQEGALAPGETITVVYGETAAGKNPGTVGPRFAQGATIVVVSDTDGDGQGKMLAAAPALTTRAAEPVEMQLIAPSQGTVGEPLELQLNVMDRFGNLVTGYAGQVTLSAPHARISFERASIEGGTLKAGVTPGQTGFLRVEARGEEKFGRVRSNPVHVTQSRPKLPIYWGDIHSHTGKSLAWVTIERHIYSSYYFPLVIYHLSFRTAAMTNDQ